MQRPKLTGAEALSLLKNGPRTQERDTQTVQELDTLVEASRAEADPNTTASSLLKDVFGEEPVVLPAATSRSGTVPALNLKPPHPIIKQTLQGTADPASFACASEAKGKWTGLARVVDTGLSGLQTYANMESKLLKQVDLATRLLELPSDVMADDMRAKYVAFVRFATQ